MIKKIPTLLLVVILLLSACIPEFTLCSAEENQTPEYVLLDLTDSSDISLLSMNADTDNCLYGGMNATFTQSQISKVNSSGQSTAASTVVATAKNGIITDWSSYTNYNIWIYSEKVTDQKFALVVRDGENRICANIMERNFSGWKKFSIPFSDFSNRNSAFDQTNVKDFYISLSYGDMKNSDVKAGYTKLTFAKIWLSKENEADYTELFSSSANSDTKSMFNRGSFAMLKADSEGQVLRLSGDGADSNESATPLFDEPMDWTGYGYLNFRIKNNSSSDSVFHFSATVNGKDAAAAVGYWRKTGIKVSGNEWQTLSLPIPQSFSFVKNPSTPIVYDAMSHIEGLRFDNITGSMSVEKIWLSGNLPVEGDFSVNDISIENGATDVSTNLKTVEFTYNQKLAPENSAKHIALRDMTNSVDIADGFEVGTFGNRLQILFTEKLNYSTEYLITVGKDIYGTPVPFASSGASVSFTTQKAGSDFETIKDRWKKSLVGDAFNNLNHSYVAYYISRTDANCKNALDTINTTDSSLPPWGDALVESADMTTQFTNIEYMALAYSMKGSIYYKDSNILQKIIYALEWMYENAYGIDEMANKGWRDTKLHNWWDWQIGSPRSLVNILILLENELDAEFIRKEAEVLEHFVPKTKDYGSNLIHFAKIMLGSALLNGNTARLQSALDAIIPEFEFDTEKYGQGFHKDGTYLFHTRHFHNGSYGSSHFMLLPEIALLVKDTEYELDLNLAENLFEIYKNSFEPLIYDNYMISMANGRSPADSTYGALDIMRAMLDTVALFDGEENFSAEISYVKSAIKKYYSSNTRLRITPIKQAEFAANIANDSSVSAAGNYELTKIYTDGDKAVHHSNGFMTAIAMSSSRVYNYECINSKNMNGWYMADGMQYTYMDGDVQYKSDWWNRSDPYKRPGTTVDTQERQEVSIKQGNEYLSSKDFVGGVTLGNTGVAVMDLESYHNETGGTTTNTGNGASAPLHSCSLTAKKAWFMFDNEVVSLGSDITANDGYEVLTIVDNRKMTSGSVSADGAEVTEGMFADTGYLNFENKLGYVFPGGENVTLDINNTHPDFTEAWISHGISPQNAGYSYITLPCKNAEQTKAYADSPDAEILANTPSVQAVCDTSSQTTGYVFWEAGSFNGIKADSACTLITTENDGYTSVAVSDPTHKLTSITLTFENSLIIPLKSYAGITFKSETGSTVVTVDTSELSGKSYEFSYFKVPDGISGMYAKNMNLQKDDNGASVVFTIANPTNAASEATVILAIYTESGNELTDVIFKPVSTGAMQTASDELSLSSAGLFKAKAFVWESLCTPRNLPVENYSE